MLQQFDDLLGRIIMFLPDNIRIEDTGRRFQRIYCRINTQLGNLPAQYGCRIQEIESRCRCGIRQVVGRHINSLYRSDGTIFSRSDPLL